jgi:hypothetical protein
MLWITQYPLFSSSIQPVSAQLHQQSFPLVMSKHLDQMYSQQQARCLTHHFEAMFGTPGYSFPALAGMDSVPNLLDTPLQCKAASAARTWFFACLLLQKAAKNVEHQQVLRHSTSDKPSGAVHATQDPTMGMAISCFSVTSCSTTILTYDHLVQDNL